jgi:hypothetical protein
MQDGATASLNVSMTSAPAGGSYVMNFKGSTLVAMRSAVNPNATVADSYVDFSVIPSLAYGPVDSTGDELWADFQNALSGDVNLGSLPYNNPFPSSYLVFVAYDDILTIPYTANGALNPAIMVAQNYGDTATLPTATAPLTPMVGPPMAPQINGLDLFTSQTINSLTPTISWSAPSVGTANAYSVHIYNLSENGDDSVTNEVAHFVATQNGIVVPPNLLQSDNQYIVQINAIYEPNTNVATAPNQQSFPVAVGQLYSAAFTIGVPGSAGSGGTAMSRAAAARARVKHPMTPLERLEQRMLQRARAHQKALAQRR